MPVLGLPHAIRACLFDLDGVLTPTALIHAAAWKEMFDAFLGEYQGPGYTPFDKVEDYDKYVDGRPREDGTRTFLASRGITLPEGNPDDPPEAHTVAGMSKRKDAVFQRVVEEQGIRPYPASVRYLHACVDAGLRRAVVSSSKHCDEIVRAAGIADLLEVTVDGNVREREKLRGKPAPDTFQRAAELLGVGLAEAAVFEDALAGVAAGRAGNFGYVVGVDRSGQADALREHGADIVIKDLGELLEQG
jgi:beta-phosphoglucomutase family hydrolase